MFWLLGGVAFSLMTVSPIIPYFTFGEDFIMVKQLGYDFIMLAALVFGVLAASMSITEEIEGRTAVTLMSKPVSRRQFLIGKFFGILLAGLGMTMILAWWFNWVLLYKRKDPVDTIPPPPQPPSWTEFLQNYAPTTEAADFLRGFFQWGVETGDVLPGVILSFCQVMVLLAVATALATRLPLVVNLVTCLLVYFLGHLTPVLVHIAKRRQEMEASSSAVSQLLTFMAQLFDTLVPSLDLFRVDSALLSDAPPPLDQFFLHVGYSALLALAYTIIGLLLGLILFEDRDLA
jgi:ABC-type Na+ efflux pump permease subunit